MATTSIADKLAKLEKKIAKREKTIADETKELDKDRAAVFFVVSVKADIAETAVPYLCITR